MSISAIPSLHELERTDEFVARHIGIGPTDEPHMLSVVGAASRRALIEAVVPRTIACTAPMALPEPVTEAAALDELRAIAARHVVLKSLIGQGCHGTITPAVILRNVPENPAWYTSCTPSQAEVSQGRLEALVNFQTIGARPHRNVHRRSAGAVSAAPLGNASVLPLSWMYLRMMGAAGPTQATETAVLAANDIAARLADHYAIHDGAGIPGLKGAGVAHECILDLRPLKDATGGGHGISAEDVAKRLIDYGFHAPTLSFPLPGTPMVEPTDYPLGALRRDKYWAPVGRVDHVYGDRHRMCACPPLGAHAQ